MSSTFDPAQLVAELVVHLHQLGVATTIAGSEAVHAADDLLRALGVDPVDQHRAIRYRVRLAAILQEGLAADEQHAENFAHALRLTGPARAGRASVTVEAVPVPLVVT